MPEILTFSSTLVTLKFSIHITFLKTGVLIKIFEAKFPYKLSYFEPLCLLDGGENCEKAYCQLYNWQ